MKLFLSLVLFFTIMTTSFSQFGRLSDKISNRIQNRLEDKLADAIANEIYKKAFKPVDEAVDEAMRKSYEDSTGTDYRSAGRAYGEFLAGLNEAVNKLPADYSFDITCDVKMKDNKNKTNELKMYYMNDGGAIGYQTMEKNKINTVVLDVKNEIMVMYTEEKGKKTGQVLPSMTKFIGALAANEVEKQKEEKVNIKKTGNKKTVAGYSCDEYLVETKDLTNQVFIASNFPVSYISAYGPFLQQFTPAAFSDAPDVMKGFVLYSKTSDKEEKETNEYEVVKVSKDKTSFKTADYKFEQMK
jgi:hypothetical protein